MQKTQIPPFIRSGNAALAVWQSVVADSVRDVVKQSNIKRAPGAPKKHVHAHSMVLGTNVFIERKNKALGDLGFDEIKEAAQGIANTHPDNVHPLLNSYLSQYYFNQALKVHAGELSSVPGHPKEFPDSDYAYIHWVKAAADWLAYWRNPFAPKVPYIDWKKSGQDISTFGVITIPENARIAIIGDFGTGLPDGTIMLMALIKDLKPDFIIHLGDIYYSGTEAECETYTQTFSQAFSKLGIAPLPVFSIPGNHEYLSGGLGFFRHVIGMNANNKLEKYNQQASYFCLRTAGNNWQFLGMDTGLNSVEGNVFTILTNAYAPWLQDTEILWHNDKLDNFNGKTILLSHHQLFSASAIIDDKEKSYLNNNLQATFSGYYNKVAAWFWGHEHILGIFKDGTEGLAKGRLVGNSGYEEWQGECPYEVQDADYPYAEPAVEVDVNAVSWQGADYNFYQHGFAMIQLQGSSATVQYYEYPVMTPDAVIPAPEQLLPPTKLDFEENL